MSLRTSISIETCLLLIGLSLALSCVTPRKSALVTINETMNDSFNPRITVVIRDDIGQIEVGAVVWLLDEENNRIYKEISNLDGKASFTSIMASNSISIMVLPDVTRYPVIKSGLKVNHNQSLIINIAVVCINECAVS
jgi:hypothetical protein